MIKVLNMNAMGIPIRTLRRSLTITLTAIIIMVKNIIIIRMATSMTTDFTDKIPTISKNIKTNSIHVLKLLQA